MPGIFVRPTAHLEGAGERGEKTWRKRDGGQHDRFDCGVKVDLSAPALVRVIDIPSREIRPQTEFAAGNHSISFPQAAPCFSCRSARETEEECQLPLYLEAAALTDPGCRSCHRDISAA